MIRRKIRKDGSMVYEARVKRGGQLLCKNFESERAANFWVNEVRYKRDKGLPLSGPVSITAMFEKYMEYAQGKGRAGSTLKQHRQRFNKHIAPFYGDVEMKTVTIEEHEEFLRLLQKQEKKLGPASCNRVRALMSVIYSTAIKKRFFAGAFKENPFAYVEPLNEKHRAIVFFTHDEVASFLEANDGAYYPLWLFMFNTGLRIGEACALHRDQIDFNASIVRVDRTWSDHENKIVMRTKGKKIRHVGLNEEALRALSLAHKDGLIFRKPDGGPILPDHVRKKLLPAACRLAEVKQLTPHGFRHTYGAQYMMGGGNIWDLSKVLGHSSVQITEQYYAHFSREHVLKRARVITQQGNVISATFGGRGG